MSGLVGTKYFVTPNDKKRIFSQSAIILESWLALKLWTGVSCGSMLVIRACSRLPLIAPT
jgi:hypothetical protein